MGEENLFLAQLRFLAIKLEEETKGLVSKDIEKQKANKIGGNRRRIT